MRFGCETALALVSEPALSRAAVLEGDLGCRDQSEATKRHGALWRLLGVDDRVAKLTRSRSEHAEEVGQPRLAPRFLGRFGQQLRAHPLLISVHEHPRIV